MIEHAVQRLLADRLVVIIRVTDPDDIPGIARCLVAGGARAIEVTSNTPGWADAVASLRAAYPDVLVGAGTITSPELAQQAIDAGAQFLVTPNTSRGVVAAAHGGGVPVIMGAMTPTEVADCVDAGADVVKLFPATTLGPSHLRALAGGPFLDTVFFAVGGIDEHNLDEWLAAGAAGGTRRGQAT